MFVLCVLCVYIVRVTVLTAATRMRQGNGSSRRAERRRKSLGFVLFIHLIFHFFELNVRN